MDRSPSSSSPPHAGSTAQYSGLEAASLGALLFVQFSFSGLQVFGKVALATIPPLALAAMRVGFATPLLLAAAGRKGRFLPPRDALGRLALLGLLGVCLNQILFISGLQLTTATNAGILMPSVPVFAVALGALLGVERTSRRRLLGILLAVAGALVVLDPSRFSFSAASSLGDLMVLLNCLSYAAFLVLQRPLVQRLGWLPVMAWAFFFGNLLVLPIGWRQLSSLDPAAIPWQAWLSVAFIILFPTLISYSLNARAISVCPSASSFW